MHCLQCGNALDIRFVSGGQYSRCEKCELDYLSVAHLMQRSERTMVREFWEYVLANNWSPSHPCPHCKKPLSMIPLEHEGREDKVLACKTCYHLILRDGTLSHFEKESHMTPLQEPDPFQKFLDRLAQASKQKWHIKLGQEDGQGSGPEGKKEYNFSINVGVAALVGGAVLFLLLSGSQAIWTLLAVACAVGATYQLIRHQQKKADTREASEGRDVKTFSQDKGVAKPGEGTSKSINNKGT